MTVVYVVIGLAIAAILGFVLMGGKSDEPKLEDLKDELIYDPETGAAMTMEDAMEDKAFGSTDDAKYYDIENDAELVFKLIPKNIRDELDVETTKAILQVQNHYLLSPTAEVGSKDNLEFITEIFANNGVKPPAEDQIQAVLKAEHDYLKREGLA